MIADGKTRLRSELLAARRKLTEDVRRAESDQLLRHLAEVVGGAATVCGYVPLGTEPGYVPLGTEPGYVPLGTEPGRPAILDTLARLCPTVLLPVARAGPDGEHLPLQWGRYVSGHLFAGRFGVWEPTGPWLPPSAVAAAQVVLVPALAVDRRGTRLGRGGGFYDRSLPLCASAARLVAVVRDAEVLEEVPGEPHDVPMTHALTPRAGLVALGNARSGDGGSST